MESSQAYHSSRSGETEKPTGQVLCFVSAKGGTGKTILSATTTYLLLKAGKRVVAIDADFSTRGLSLFLLGGILDSADVEFKNENCLAEALFEGVPVDRVTPRVIRREGLEYHVILANRNVYRGGVPDERILGSSGQADLTSRYFHFLRDLCERLRRDYDYVIVDTRGGYDPTTAAPATVSDGYIVVLEADRLSMEQLRGFIQRMSELGKESPKPATLRGFIVNKAIFSVDDKLFPEELLRLYDAKTYGVIPADRDVIRGYQRKNIPTEKFPDSDFAYFSLGAVEHLIAPEVNWEEQDDARSRFKQLASQLRAAWHARRNLESLQKGLPLLHLLLVSVAAVAYLLYRRGAAGFSLKVFYIALASSVLGAILASMAGSLGLFKNQGFSARVRVSLAASLGVLWLGFFYLAAVSVPKTFSTQALLQRIREQDGIISLNATKIDALQKDAVGLQTQIDFLKTDKQRAEAAAASAQDQLGLFKKQNDQLLAQLSGSSSTTTIAAVVPGYCSLVVLKNSGRDTVDLSGWRIDYPPYRIVATLEKGTTLQAESVLTLLLGPECSPSLEKVLGGGANRVLTFGEFLPLDTRRGKVRLLDAAGNEAGTFQYGLRISQPSK